MSIRENIARVRERMAAACRRAGRSPDDVTLIGVSKGFPVDAVREACAAGLRDVGENRVQEAAGKIDALSALSEAPRWHLVGHLQANKAKTAAGLFAMIHSVDSLRLAQALSRHADESVSVFIEVNVAQEASKFGLPPNEVTSLLPSINALPALDVRGLMTVAPETDDPEAVRPIFRQLRELRDSSGLCELSMGMTGDFEVAIEEGATMVRVGRAIFGPRPER